MNIERKIIITPINEISTTAEADSEHITYFLGNLWATVLYRFTDHFFTLILSTLASNFSCSTIRRMLDKLELEVMLMDESLVAESFWTKSEHLQGAAVL